MHRISVTILADDAATELDVEVTATDAPDRACGLLDWTLDVSAARPLSQTETDRACAAARAGMENGE